MISLKKFGILGLVLGQGVRQEGLMPDFGKYGKHFHWNP